jgi:diguanylate cyclase (GGDEF)-like protein
VEHALARGARSLDSSIVLYLDLDDFKAVNDSMGHAAGDVLLRSVADRLLACVRPGDTVARLGGDEFAVLLDAAPMADAEQVAGRIVAELGRSFDLPGGERSVRVSVGIAAGRPGVDTAEELVSNADTAMFAAKKRGKNRAEVFVPDMRHLAVASSRRRSELDMAVANDELCLYYQPIVAVDTGRTVAVEALLRWRHPRLGLLGPADFVSLAEESGQIVTIGSWVLREACAQAAAWRQTLPGARDVEMCVNLSPRQLQDPGLVADVAAALEASGLPPRLLTLEVTESAVVEDVEAAVQVLTALKALGLRLAVDDFGTGYSALTYVRRFGADVLKIDQSFVAGIAEDSEAAALLWAIANLGRALRTDVVAEGVETMAQLELLTSLGCDRAQGFNWSPPVPAAELEPWLGGHGEPGAPPLRVLVVDDQDHMRGAVGVALCTSDRFVVVGQAADGAAAVDLAGSVQPDLVLLDERMPGLSGTDAVPGIVAAAPGATIVFLTADDGRRAAPPEPHVAGSIDKAGSLHRLVELLEPLLPLAG